MFNILVVNPGSTSTKVALFADDAKVAQENIQLDEDIARLALWDQFDSRLETIERFVQKQRIDQLHAIVGRGGLIRPVSRGTFIINETMLHDARTGLQGQHASNLGCALAYHLAEKWACPSFIVDPVCVDEMEPLARYSGHPVITRKALSHALNIGAVINKRAKELGKNSKETNFVVAHLGGGITVAAVKGGRLIDVNNAAADGPFSPERSGTLPMLQFVDLCFSGDYSKDQVKRLVMGDGGLKAYLGTADVKQIEENIQNGDSRASEVFDAMCYQIAKEIGAMSSVLSGQIDNIILTGGLAHSQRLVDCLEKRIRFIAPLHLYPGEFEMEALALGALRVLAGDEKANDY